MKHRWIWMLAALAAGGARAHAETTTGTTTGDPDEPAGAPVTRVRHVPPAEADPRAPVLIEAEVARGWDANLELRWRAAGAGAWAVAPFQLVGEGHYQATIPAEAARPPGFEYFITGTDRAGQTVTHFASASDPHRVAVFEDSGTVRRQRELDRLHGRQARVRFAGEWVDYGTRTIQGEAIPDSFYRIDADFTYRLLRYPLYSMRFGFSRLVGETPSTERGDGECDGNCRFQAGYRAGGWFELRFRVSRSIDLDTRGMVQATPAGFNVGGRSELRFGPEYGSHVAIGGEGIADIGHAVFFRLGWDTVPALPMAATIELTNLPATHRATAVRLVYDLGHPFENGLRLGARVGYQARDSGIGGVTAGLNMSFDFEL